MPGASPVKWFGGKSVLAARIAAMLPTHITYVEPFAGSAAVLFAKHQSPVEVINDADGDLMRFWRVLRDHPDELARRLALTPYSRAEWNTSGEPTDDKVEAARRFFVLCQQTFNARGRGGWAYCRSETDRGVAANVSRWWTALGRLAPAAARLAGVQLEHDDWVLERFDAPGTCYYLDPPYHPETRKSGRYAHELTDRDHDDLVQCLLSIRGTALLSGYAHPAYDPLERAGWARIDWPVVARAANRAGREAAQRVESLWIHPRAGMVRQRSIFECAAPGCTAGKTVLWPAALGAALMIGFALAH